MALVLIIDDNETMRDGAAAIVKKMGHDVATAKSGTEGIVLFGRKAPDMVVTDLKMEGADGLEVLHHVREKDPDAVVMVMTGFGSVKTAVEAMKDGAFDFVEKPFSPDVLRAKVTAGLALRVERKNMEKFRGLSEVHADDNAQRFRSATTKPGGTRYGIIGKSDAMTKVFADVEKIARTDTTVYIQGESGTGKELVARAIHDLSVRKDQPFVGINCAAIPSTLLESELFGHEKGSFTGAVKRKLGRFELAQGGTLFLDEIGDVPLEVQAKLLRALQEKQIERVGGEALINIDVRIVSATHRDIRTMVQQGAFREDLLYRLHIIPIHLPPLRDRPGDIEELARFFVQKLAKKTNPRIQGIDDAAMAALKAYRWPGNVRELENVIEQALVFSEGELITADDLPALLGSLKPSSVVPTANLPTDDDPRSLDEVLEGLEKALILRAYNNASGVKTETARRLGIKTSALYYKLAKYGIE
jgi:two-component system, NtrC family, response regulator HydG